MNQDRPLGGWRAKRLARKNSLECGMRVVEGAQPGLSGRWRHGVAELSKGHVRFRSYLPSGIRVYRPFTPPVIVAVDWTSEAKKSGLRDAWSVLPGMDVVTLRTAESRVEWALPPAQREWALRLLEQELEP